MFPSTFTPTAVWLFVYSRSHIHCVLLCSAAQETLLLWVFIANVSRERPGRGRRRPVQSLHPICYILLASTGVPGLSTVMDKQHVWYDSTLRVHVHSEYEHNINLHALLLSGKIRHARTQHALSQSIPLIGAPLSHATLSLLSSPSRLPFSVFIQFLLRN